jgi:hypothetical protein
MQRSSTMSKLPVLSSTLSQPTGSNVPAPLTLDRRGVLQEKFRAEHERRVVQLREEMARAKEVREREFEALHAALKAEQGGYVEASVDKYLAEKAASRRQQLEKLCREWQLHVFDTISKQVLAGVDGMDALAHSRGRYEQFMSFIGTANASARGVFLDSRIEGPLLQPLKYSLAAVREDPTHRATDKFEAETS